VSLGRGGVVHGRGSGGREHGGDGQVRTQSIIRHVASSSCLRVVESKTPDCLLILHLDPHSVNSMTLHQSSVRECQRACIGKAAWAVTCCQKSECVRDQGPANTKWFAKTQCLHCPAQSTVHPNKEPRTVQSIRPTAPSPQTGIDTNFFRETPLPS
jgi:hypothetical protein